MSLDNEPEEDQTEEKCKSFPSGLHEQRFQTQNSFFPVIVGCLEWGENADLEAVRAHVSSETCL